MSDLSAEAVGGCDGVKGDGGELGVVMLSHHQGGGVSRGGVNRVSVFSVKSDGTFIVTMKKDLTRSSYFPDISREWSEEALSHAQHFDYDLGFDLK